MSSFMLSKVNLSSLRYFSPLENENAISCDTMRILMQVYLMWKVSEMFWPRKMVMFGQILREYMGTLNPR